MTGNLTTTGNVGIGTTSPLLSYILKTRQAMTVLELSIALQVKVLYFLATQLTATQVR